MEYVLVFPFYPCGDLFQLLAKRGPLPETIAQGILSQLVRALHYLHCDRGIVHRDVKLENILVESMNGANVSVVLADFGLVCAHYRIDHGNVEHKIDALV